MPQRGYTKTIKNLVQGDAFDMDLVFHNVPNGQRIVAATLTLKANLADTDASALYQVTVTRTDDGLGNLIIADGASDVTGIAYHNLGTIRKGTCFAHWQLPPELTATFAIGPGIYYGYQVRSSAGKPHEPEHGFIYPIAQIQTT
jgi:hypothetical protein